METNEKTPSQDRFGDGVSEETKKIARTSALKFGLYLGAFNILLALGLYLFDPVLMAVNPWVGSAYGLISILVCVFLTLELRKSVGGYWPFRLAFSSIVIMFIVSTVLATVYQYVLYQVVDKELGGKMYEAIIKKSSDDLSAKGLSSEAIEAQLKTMKNFIPVPGTAKNIMSTLGISLASGLVFALILASIFKKERPVFSTSA